MSPVLKTGRVPFRARFGACGEDGPTDPIKGELLAFDEEE